MWNTYYVENYSLEHLKRWEVIRKLNERFIFRCEREHHQIIMIFFFVRLSTKIVCFTFDLIKKLFIQKIIAICYKTTSLYRKLINSIRSFNQVSLRVTLESYVLKLQHHVLDSVFFLSFFFFLSLTCSSFSFLALTLVSLLLLLHLLFIDQWATCFSYNSVIFVDIGDICFGFMGCASEFKSSNDSDVSHDMKHIKLHQIRNLPSFFLVCLDRKTKFMRCKQLRVAESVRE